MRFVSCLRQNCACGSLASDVACGDCPGLGGGPRAARDSKHSSRPLDPIATARSHGRYQVSSPSAGARGEPSCTTVHRGGSSADSNCARRDLIVRPAALTCSVSILQCPSCQYPSCQCPSCQCPSYQCPSYQCPSSESRVSLELAWPALGSTSRIDSCSNRRRMPLTRLHACSSRPSCSSVPLRLCMDSANSLHL